MMWYNRKRIENISDIWKEGKIGEKKRDSGIWVKWGNL